jgi:trans-2,3-dihydro-3-hydroxyanthranilate isomerase
MIFYIVDVFAEAKYAGNQLAVFRDCARLSDGEMQRLAREMNFSETTFILSDEPREGGYDVRIFTPMEEVPFAGHPTLGTAFIIQQEIIRNPVAQVQLDLKVGRIPVTLQYDGARVGMLEMEQKPPEFGRIHDATRVAATVSLRPEDMDSRFPVQEVSTGLPFIIAPIRTLAAVQRALVDRARYLELIRMTEAKGLLIFALEAVEPGDQIHARMFAPQLGVEEDPATGSACGCLAGYLVKYRCLGSETISCRVEQGYEIGRPSRLYLRAAETSSGIAVHVGGKAILVARGEFQ